MYTQIIKQTHKFVLLMSEDNFPKRHTWRMSNGAVAGGVAGARGGAGVINFRLFAINCHNAIMSNAFSHKRLAPLTLLAKLFSVHFHSPESSVDQFSSTHKKRVHSF